MDHEQTILGLVFMLAASVVVMVVYQRPVPLRRIKHLVIIGVCIRVIAGLSRQPLMKHFYGGASDAMAYYYYGLLYNESFGSGMFAIQGEQYWGTEIVRYFSGLVLYIIGPTRPGEFVLFSLLGFIGLANMIRAYHASRPAGSSVRYASLVLLWPSLWFWPSSIGKEALILFGLGIAMRGYVGNRGKVRHILLGIGSFLVFLIRPHVAVVLAASFACGEWLGKGRWTTMRTIQTVLAGVVLIFVIRAAGRSFGFDPTDFEATQQFLSERAAKTQTGGSTIAPVGSGPFAVLLAFVNILFRPFLFEARNGLSLISALEMTFLWMMVWWRRHAVVAGLRRWRHNRFSRVTIPFTVGYVLMIGLTFSNLGIIARQRVIILPMLLAVVVGLGDETQRATKADDAAA